MTNDDLVILGTINYWQGCLDTRPANEHLVVRIDELLVDLQRKGMELEQDARGIWTFIDVDKER